MQYAVHILGSLFRYRYIPKTESPHDASLRNRVNYIYQIVHMCNNKSNIICFTVLATPIIIWTHIPRINGRSSAESHIWCEKCFFGWPICYNFELLLADYCTCMTLGFSSDTRRQVVKEDLSMLMNKSLDNTSNFFTCSPCTLVSPDMPWLKNIIIRIVIIIILNYSK